MPSPNKNGDTPYSPLASKDVIKNDKEEEKEEDLSPSEFYDANEESQQCGGKKDRVTKKNKEKKKRKEKTTNGSSSKEETDEEYRLRVYGTSTTNTAETIKSSKSSRRTSSSSQPMRRLSRQLSSSLHKQYMRRKSSVVESLPDTPAGWIHFITTASSLFLAYELQLQKLLTSPPYVFKQSLNPTLDEIYKILTGPTKEEGILSRDIQPSLGIGTRGVLASTLAYLHLGPSSHSNNCLLDKDEERCSFREIMIMAGDGAQIAIDWEIPSSPISPYPSSLSPRETIQQRKQNVLNGPITQPVVLILHGINNDASFGYIKSLMRACTDRGWIAAGMNFRGMGGMDLKTPRGYNGAYTGDLRCIVHKITSRMKFGQGGGNDVEGRSNLPPPPLFLVGNSLGANIMTKYLGEEGIVNTLPENVAGGISLGNPLHIHSGNLSFPWNIILGLGVKKTYLEHLPTFLPFLKKDAVFRNEYLRILFTTPTIGGLDDVASLRFIRNQTHYPYMTRVGYRNGGEEYWNDASSFHHVPHINVPFLKITAQDDFLVYGSSLRKLSRSLENPNVLVVKTKCGGHLGWQESPPPPKEGDDRGKGSFAASWSDAATTDFIDAVIRVREMKWREDMEKKKKKEMEDEAKKKLAAEARAVLDRDMEHETMQRRTKDAVIQAATVDANKIRSRL